MRLAICDDAASAAAQVLIESYELSLYLEAGSIHAPVLLVNAKIEKQIRAQLEAIPNVVRAGCWVLIGIRYYICNGPTFQEMVDIFEKLAWLEMEDKRRMANPKGNRSFGMETSETFA